MAGANTSHRLNDTDYTDARLMDFTNRIFPVVMCLLLTLSFDTQAEDRWYDFDRLYFQAGTYVHFDPDEEHDGNRLFASLEAIRSDDWLFGLALFNNSFDQFSQYLYGGKIWRFHEKWEGFHAKITAGLIHGYKDEFEDKVPFNDLGVAPAIIPGVGYSKGRFGADVYLLGVAGLLFTAGMSF